MLQKIYISSLIIAVIFSTTGYTVTEHICKMMVGTLADQECMMHDNMVVQESMTCCENEDLECERNSQLPLSDCCEDQTISNKIEDDFILIKRPKE